jgi:glycosyltransferase involved in cell wall biosynthesis
MIILIGPFPPKVGGDSRHMMDTEAYLKQHGYSYRVFNISRPVRLNFLVESIILYVRYLVFLIRTYNFKNQVILNCNEGGLVILGIPLLFLYRRNRLKLRVFGGGLLNYYNHSGIVTKILIKCTLKYFPKVYLQTKNVIDAFSELVPSKNFVHLPASIHLPLFCKSLVNLDQRPFRVIYAGHLWKAKGIDFILQLSMIEDSGMIFELYGPLDDYSKEILEKYNVVYHKPYEHKMCYDVFANFDVLIFPSTARCEGYPGVILEAMAIGLPVIAFNWNGINEIINKENGILLDEHTLDSLYESLKLLRDDSEKYRSLARGSHRSMQKFNFEEVVKVLLSES